MSCELTQRITDYLTCGGLFNPELANHEAVRDLLIECREELAKLEHRFDTPESHSVKWSIPVDPNNFGEPLAPPRKEWVGLTIEDIVNARIECGANDRELPFVFCYAIEAKLKEKNT